MINIGMAWRGDKRWKDTQRGSGLTRDSDAGDDDLDNADDALALELRGKPSDEESGLGEKR